METNEELYNQEQGALESIGGDAATGTTTTDDSIDSTAIAPTGTDSPTGTTGVEETTATGTTGTDQPTGTTSADTALDAETGITGETAEAGIKEEQVWDISPTGVAATSVKPEELDYKIIAKDVGIEMQGKGKDDFVQSMKTALETASEKTELDLSAYNEETQAFIDMLESPESDIVETLSPITKIDHYLANHTSEQIMTDYLIKEKKIGITEARDQIAEMIADESFDGEMKKVSEIFVQGKKEIVDNTINNFRQASLARKNGQDRLAQSERTNMVNALEEMDDFLGLKIPDNIKKTLKQQIESGVLSEANNNARTQVNARLFDLFGGKALERFETRMNEERQTAYNKGYDAIDDSLHAKPPRTEAGEAVDRSAGQKKEDEGPLDGLLTVEDDMIETQ